PGLAAGLDLRHGLYGRDLAAQPVGRPLEIRLGKSESTARKFACLVRHRADPPLRVAQGRPAEPVRIASGRRAAPTASRPRRTAASRFHRTSIMARNAVLTCDRRHSVTFCGRAGGGTGALRVRLVTYRSRAAGAAWSRPRPSMISKTMQ